MQRALLEKLTVPQLVKDFLALYENRRFVTVFTGTPHLSLSSARSIQSRPQNCFLKIHLIILPPSKWPLYFSFPHQIPVCFSDPFSTCHMPNQSTSSSFTLIIFGDCKPRGTSCHVLQSPVSSENDFGVHFRHTCFLLFILKTISSIRHPVV